MFLNQVVEKRQNRTEHADHSFSLREGQHHNFLNFEDRWDNENVSISFFETLFYISFYIIISFAHLEMFEKFIDFCKRKVCYH